VDRRRGATSRGRRAGRGARHLRSIIAMPTAGDHAPFAPCPSYMPLRTVTLFAALLSAAAMAVPTVRAQAPHDRLNLHPALQVALNAQPSAPAAFDATAAYVPLQGTRLVAVDLETGRIRWSADLEVTQAPAVTSGVVIVATGG